MASPSTHSPLPPTYLQYIWTCLPIPPNQASSPSFTLSPPPSPNTGLSLPLFLFFTNQDDDLLQLPLCRAAAGAELHRQEDREPRQGHPGRRRVHRHHGQEVRQHRRREHRGEQEEVQVYYPHYYTVYSMSPNGTNKTMAFQEAVLYGRGKNTNKLRDTGILLQISPLYLTYDF